jgi:D-alanyl-D-alanine carboxypeptidase
MTKIMTCYTINRLVKAGVITYDDVVEVTNKSAGTIGTTAKL